MSVREGASAGGPITRSAGARRELSDAVEEEVEGANVARHPPNEGAEKPRRCAFRVPGADESAVDAARGETDTAGCPERESAFAWSPDDCTC
ncbi:unnamed protein product [Lampetra fluviatilis]